MDHWKLNGFIRVVKQVPMQESIESECLICGLKLSNFGAHKVKLMNEATLRGQGNYFTYFYEYLRAHE
jgi:hypothetical protein